MHFGKALNQVYTAFKIKSRTLTAPKIDAKIPEHFKFNIVWI